jgi:hypothetical protein
MTPTEENNDWIECKDYFLNGSALRSSRKCSMCNEFATWIPNDKEDKDCPVYCDRHFPCRICDCEICKENR